MRRRVVLIIGLFFGLFLTPPVYGAVPKMINYQGRLTDANNVLITTTRYFQFEIYDAATLGTLLWSSYEDFANDCGVPVTPSDGVFNVIVGDDTVVNMSDLDIDFDTATYYLQIKISATQGSNVACESPGGGASYETLNPRQRIVSSGYTMTARMLSGDSGEKITNPADDILALIGVGGADNTDLYVNLDGTYPVLYSNTDTKVGIDDDLEFVGAQSVTTSTGNLTFSPAGNLIINTTGGTIDIDDGTIDLSTQAVAVTLNNAANALNFDSNTLSLDALNNRVGIGTTGPDSPLDVLSIGGSQLRLTYTDGSVYTTLNTDSSGNLNIDATGTKTTIADDLQITGNDLIDSGTTPRINLGATTTLTNTTTTLSGTATLTASSLATFTTASSLTMSPTSLTLGGSATIYGGSAASGTLTLVPTSNATKGNLQFFSSSYYLNPSGQAVFATDETINGIDINAGVISDATWQGTAIAPAFGGTGDDTSATTGVPYISAGNWLYDAQLAVSRGGTGAGTFTQYGVLYGNATSAIGVTAAGSTGQVLLANTSAAPSWGTVGSAHVTDNSLDFVDFENTLDLDANLTLNQSTNTWAQNFDGTTTTGLTYNADSLTSGKAIAVVVDPATVSSAFTGDLASVSYSPTYTGGVGLNSTGNLLDLARSVALNNTGNTLTVSGAVATVADSATLTAGTLTHSADVLRVAQDYTANSGAALNVTTAGTGLALRVNDDGAFTDATPFVVDGSGSVGIGTASPTSGFVLDTIGRGRFSTGLSVANTSTTYTLDVTGTGGFSTSVTSQTYTGTGAVTVSSGGGLALTLDSASGNIVMNDNLFFEKGTYDTTFSITTPTANRTITFPNAGGTVAVSATAPITLSATGAIELTTPLGITYGGTAGTATPTAGAIAYGTGTAYAFNTIGSTNQVLTSQVAGAPTFQNIASLLTPGNDIDISGTTNATIDIESQLDYVSTISRASSNLTLQTTTSGNIILNPVGYVGVGTNLTFTSTGDSYVYFDNGAESLMWDDAGNTYIADGTGFVLSDDLEIQGNIVKNGSLSINAYGNSDLILQAGGNNILTLNYGNYVTFGGTSSAPTGAAGRIYYDTTANSMYFNDGSLWRDMQGVTSEIYAPEYPSAVLAADGIDNSGTLVTGGEIVSDVLYSFYRWTGTPAAPQDYDIYIHLKVPDNFKSWNTNDAIKFYYKTGLNAATNNKVEWWIYEDGTAAALRSSAELFSNNVWASDSATSAQLSALTAGEIYYIKIKFSANNTANAAAYAGKILVYYQ